MFEKERDFFTVWMSHVNEYIQDTAESFGERFFLQNAWEAYEKAPRQNVKNCLYQVLRLHMISYLKDNLGFFITNEIISLDGARSIEAIFPQAVKDFVPHMNDCVEGINMLSPVGTLPQIVKDEYWKHAGLVAKDAGKPFDFTKEV
jgi:hypothetical protein